MKYRFTIYGIYPLKHFFEYEAESYMIGQDELERKNNIMAGSNHLGTQVISLALEPKSISITDWGCLIIGNSCLPSKVIYPTNEALEQVANEVSEVIDNLKIKKVHCIFYVPDEPKPTEVDLELFNGNRVVFKGMNFFIPDNRKEPYVFKIELPIPIKLSEV